jgi:N-acetylmuramic acid 6-phosphate etherase
MRYVLGLDGGGSKTAVVIINENGDELGRGRSSSSNYHVVGLESAKEAVRSAMQEAAANAGLDLSQMTAATWALAGAGRPADRKILEGLNADLLPGIPTQIVTDAAAALMGGVGARSGIVLIAGTGTIAYGENEVGEQARAGGWGYLLDHGSGYGLAHAALYALVRAADGRDLATSLTEKVREHLQLDDITALVNWLYAPENSVTKIATLAPIVLEAASEGDLIANDVAARAVEELASSVAAVARQLGVWERPFPIVLAGGLLLGSKFYRRVAAQAIRTQFPHARLMMPQADAATGAAMLALEILGRSRPPVAVADDEEASAWASEQRNVLTEELDLHSAVEIAGLMHLEDNRAVTAVRSQLPAIANAIDAIADRMRQGGRLIYVGAGTSGRLGTLDASECPPTFGISSDLVVGVMAGGKDALVDAIEGAEDKWEMGRQDLADLNVGPLDSVIGIAASGRTPYVVGALEGAKERGALTGAIICNLPAPMADIADHVIAALVGPEALAGSTRLKAGTAQKLVLNMLSTGVMVRLGKTYGNLMVDVAQHNIKLQNRARRIVAQATRVDEAAASAAFDANDHNVKAAIVSVLLGCSPDEAKVYLDEAGGVVRTAVANRQNKA